MPETHIPTPEELQQSIAAGIEKLEGVTTSIYQHTLNLENRMGVPYPVNYLLAASTGLVGVFIYSIVSVFLALVLPIAVPLITLLMGAILQVRKDTVPAQAELSAAALSEFLGTDIDASHMATGKGADNAVVVARQLGDALYTRLYTEFGLGGTGAPGPGEKAARTFSGFAVNFATQNAMISTLADALSFHELEQFRELGVEVARNLGLGRMQRMALGTLLDNVIRKPYTRELQAKLRPMRMSPVEYVHAHNRGDISEDELKAALGAHGYPDTEIEYLLHEYTDKLTVGELVTLLRYGDITEDQALKTLSAQGMDAPTAALRLKAAQRVQLNDNVKAYLSKWNDLVRNRVITTTDWNATVDTLPFFDEEKRWEAKTNSLYLEYYPKQLTWTQVITAFEQGIVDVNYVEDWLTQKGYSPEDVTDMELLLAVKFDAFQAAADKKKKAATPAPPAKPAT